MKLEETVVISHSVEQVWTFFEDLDNLPRVAEFSLRPRYVALMVVLLVLGRQAPRRDFGELRRVVELTYAT